jgi:PAP2 superfamily
VTAKAAVNIVALSTVAPIDARAASSQLPAQALAAGAPRGGRVRTRWWLEALTIVWLCWVYDAVNNLAPLRLGAALRHGEQLLSVERALHLDVERALDRWLAAHHTLGLALSDYYDNAHFVVTLGLLGWLWWRGADAYRPLRNVLVLVNVLAFAVFWLFPVAPPRMLPGFVDVVAATHAVGSWHTGALASAADELAAMPSLHIAWAAWCTLAAWRMWTRRWVRALALAYPFVTAFAVIATGNHYVLDLLGGLATLAAAVLVVRALDAARAPERARTPLARGAR